MKAPSRRWAAAVVTSMVPPDTLIGAEMVPLFQVIVPSSVSVNDPVRLAFSATLVMLTFASIVTAWLMMTLSQELGSTPPCHVAVFDQLPGCAVVMVVGVATVKLLKLVPVPPGPVTLIVPVEALNGTSVLIWLSLTTLTWELGVPLKATPVAPVKFEPYSATPKPTGPVVGSKLATEGSVAPRNCATPAVQSPAYAVWPFTLAK